MIALGWWWLGSHPTLHPPLFLTDPTTSTAAVSPETSPETPTVDGREALSEAWRATVTKLPWEMIDGVARSPDDDSSSEAAPNSPSGADCKSTGSWFRGCRKAAAETTKRKAQELEAEFQKKRATKGWRSAFVFYESESDKKK
jgi:hypothetical protein